MSEDKKDNEKMFTFDYMINGVEWDEKLLNTKEVSEMLKLSTTTLEHLRLKGDGPKFVRVGSAVRYKASDVFYYMKTLESYASTSESTVKKRINS